MGSKTVTALNLWSERSNVKPAANSILKNNSGSLRFEIGTMDAV